MIPKVILYNSVSLDGRLDGFKISKKIYNEIKSEINVDAVIMDVSTFEIRFNVSSKETENKNSNQLIVVPDNNGNINWKNIIEISNLKNILILCSRSTSQEYLNYLEKSYINHMIIGYDDVNWATALEELNTQFGVKTILVQADGSLNGKLLRDDLVEEIYVLLHPTLVGGNSPDSLYVAPDISSDDLPLDLRLLEMRRLDNELIFLNYRIMNYKF